MSRYRRCSVCRLNGVCLQYPICDHIVCIVCTGKTFIPWSVNLNKVESPGCVKCIIEYDNIFQDLKNTDPVLFLQKKRKYDLVYGDAIYENFDQDLKDDVYMNNIFIHNLSIKCTYLDNFEKKTYPVYTIQNCLISIFEEIKEYHDFYFMDYAYGIRIITCLRNDPVLHRHFYNSDIKLEYENIDKLISLIKEFKRKPNIKQRFIKKKYDMFFNF